MLVTLVRHNLWTARDFPLYRNGLEPLPVGTKTALLIREHHGVLFSSPDKAWDAAEAFMYPSGDMTSPADPAGDFLELPWLRLPLFVPQVSVDLLAA